MASASSRRAGSMWSAQRSRRLVQVLVDVDDAHDVTRLRAAKQFRLMARLASASWMPL